MEPLQQLQALADESPQVAQLRRLQELANNSPQAAQLRRLQELANNSPQVNEPRQLQAMAQGAERRAEAESATTKPETATAKPNLTGLPDQLKSNIEALSGLSMDAVRVHYNSTKPAQLNALAYAQGTDIHLGPGQEQHLPHEAWHVVQQAQGRVRPTLQMAGGVAVNDDAGLEREADVLGRGVVGGVGGSFGVVQGNPFESTPIALNSIDSRNWPPISLHQSDTPLQAVWIKDPHHESQMQWDKSINGIRWYYNQKKDMYFYLVDQDEHWYAEDDKIRDGANILRKFEDWQRAGQKRVEGIQDRVNKYNEILKNGRKMGPTNDESTFVEDTLPEEFKFLHNNQPTETHFYNTYSDNTAEMRENYKSEKVESFFASDVFFSQLAAVKNPNSNDLLEALPQEPPKKIVRDTIDNVETKNVLKNIHGGEPGKTVLLPSNPNFGKVLQTPNGKATFNLLNDFNFINRQRNLPSYTFIQITLLKNGFDPDTGWKIELELSQGGS
ncbi:MAG: DUF4157 domain-containing protein [Cyanobium sp.]